VTTGAGIPAGGMMCFAALHPSYTLPAALVPAPTLVRITCIWLKVPLAEQSIYRSKP